MDSLQHFVKPAYGPYGRRVVLDSDYLVSNMNHMNTLEYSKQVAENVSKALNGANLSVSATAEKTGIPRTTLSRHLNHPETAPFDVIELSRIASITRKTVSSLTRFKATPALTDKAVA